MNDFYKKVLFFFLTFLLVFTNCQRFGGPSYVSEISQRYDIHKNLDFAKILSEKNQIEPSVSNHFLKGAHQESIIWYKIRLKELNQKENQLLLEVGSSNISELNFFYYDDHSRNWIQKSSNSNLSADQREIQSLNYIFSFYPSIQEKELYLQVKTIAGINVPISVLDLGQLIRYNEGNQIIKSWISGYNLLLAIVFLIVFILLKDKTYLIFSAYIGFLMLGIFEKEKIAGDFVNFSNLISFPYLHPIATLISYMFGGIFSLKYINIKIQTKSEKYITYFLYSNLPISLLLFLVPYSFSLLILSILTISQVLLIIGFTFRNIELDRLELSYFVSAWIIALVGLLVDLAWDLHLIPDGYFFEGGYSYFSCFHLLLLIMSIIIRIRNNDRLRMESQSKVIELEKRNIKQKERFLQVEEKSINAKLKIQAGKNAFIRLTTNSFKEPLQNIQGLSEGLLDKLDGDLNYAQTQSIQGILQTSRLMTHAINDLVDYSFIESNSIELKKLVFDVGVLSDIAIQSVIPLIGNRDLEFINLVQESLPLVEADENRLHQILYNLLYSCLQNSDQGDIVISAKPVPGYVNLTINYPGKKILFPSEDFVSLSQDLSTHSVNPVFDRSLNLFVTKKLITLHSGKLEQIELESGNSIILSIPVSQNQSKNVVPRIIYKKQWAEYNLNSHFKKISREELTKQQETILVIDDEILNLETYKGYLESFDYNVITAQSGREALRLVKEKLPDLIVVDMVMPYMTGTKFCELLRETFDKTLLPVILLTNRYGTGDLIGTLDLVNDYLMKPLNKEKLLIRVKNLLNIAKMNNAYKRFVPVEIISLLKKKSIQEIKLGDQISKEMTVLFSDLRSYTQLSEKMTPEESFQFLNSYLRRVGPMVRKHKGFIDKYMGDAIMALYPNSPDDAVRSAIDIQKAISVYNRERVAQGRIPIKSGIGIHTGEVILGTIGEDERMEGTVVSDAVNLSSRLENLTKLYDASILISMDTFIALDDQEEFNFRILDRVKVKGKEKFVTVIEIIDGYEEKKLEAMLECKIFFEEGVTFYLNKEFDKAIELFKKVIRIIPDDKATRIYIQRAEYYKEHNVPIGWDGVETLEEKFF